LEDVVNEIRSRSSTSGSGSRGAVPLIGRLCTVPSRSIRRNRSGDELITVTSSKRRNAAYGAGLICRSVR
jgi:hypothetical protein